MDDVIVVGAGWAGLSATAFALEQGLKVRLIAQGIGTVIITPGWISVWDTLEGDPIAAIERMIAQVPDHPYALAGIEALSGGLAAFQQIAAKIGLPYSGDRRTNQVKLTALGTRQYPLLVTGGQAADSGTNPLYVGFTGWRDFYPTLAGAATVTIPLPDADRPWDFTPTDLARAFDDVAYRRQVISAIKPTLNGASAVGFPAVLGLDDPALVLAELHQGLGVPVFELPTLPPSVAGTRLYNRLRRYFLDQRVRMQVGHPVVKGIVEQGRAVGVQVGAAGKPQAFRAKAVILATGGLYGGGLFSDDRGKVWEPLFDLPVQSERDQTKWFQPELLDPRGHAVHHFGIKVNAAMQPISSEGKVLFDGLYCCGHLIAQPRHAAAPTPAACSEGVALATAYKAIRSVREAIGSTP